MRAREALIKTDVFGGSGPRQGRPGVHAGRIRHRTVRRGARAAAPGRAQPAARGADDDPGGVGTARVDGSGAPRVLPLPRIADGALGRARRGLLHRRHRDRRRAGPQRPAAVPDLGDRRRPGRDGVGGRCARPRPEHRRAEDAPAARPDVPGRHGAGPDRRRRGDQGRTRRRAALSGVARRRSVRSRRAAPGRLRADAAPPRGVAPADLRVHLRGAEPAGGADGADRSRGAGLDGYRHPDRGALGAAADALRLLPAAVRPGDQPAAGRHPRRGGDQPAGHRGARGRPAQPERRVVPPDRAPQPDPAQRRVVEADLRRSRSRDPRPQARHARRGDPMPVSGQPRRPGPQRGAGQRAGEGVLGHPRRRPHHRAVRPRVQRADGADPVAAVRRRGAPSSRSRPHAHQGRPGRRGGRRPRGAPHGRAVSASAPRRSIRTWRSSRSRTWSTVA